MPRVPITVIQPGAALSVTALNLQLGAWDVVSAGVDEDNVRDEGVDGLNFVNNAIVPLPSAHRTCEPYAYDGDITDATPPTSLTLMDDGTNPIAIGPIDHDGTDGDMLIVRCSTEIKLGVTAGAIARARLLLRYSLDWNGTVAGAGAATWVSLSTTERLLRSNATNFTLVPAYANYSVSHRFDVAGAIDSSTLRFALWGYVEYAADAPTLVLSDPSMHATLMHR